MTKAKSKAKAKPKSAPKRKAVKKPVRERSHLIVAAGERVMDSATGKVICVVKNDIVPGSPLHAQDFHEFAAGEMPWLNGQRMDTRCVRPTEDLRGWQIFAEGEWRP